MWWDCSDLLWPLFKYGLEVDIQCIGQLTKVKGQLSIGLRAAIEVPITKYTVPFIIDAPHLVASCPSCEEETSCMPRSNNRGAEI